MDIQFELVEKNLIVKLHGDLDHHNAEETREKIDREIENVKAKNIIFDFSDVTFMDSSGIGMVIGRYKVLQKLNGQAFVVELSDIVNKIFDMSGLFKIIKKYETVELCLKDLK